MLFKKILSVVLFGASLASSAVIDPAAATVDVVFQHPKPQLPDHHFNIDKTQTLQEAIDFFNQTAVEQCFSLNFLNNGLIAHLPLNKTFEEICNEYNVQNSITFKMVLFPQNGGWGFVG